MHLPWRDVAPGKGPEISTSVTRSETAMLAKLAKGKHVLEVGSAFGYSAIVMALGGAERVTALDPHLWLNSYDPMVMNLRSYGVSDRVWINRNIFALEKLVARAQKFDFIFIDGDHQEAGVTYDIEHALKLLEPGALLAMHDVKETCCCPDVERVCERLLPEPISVTDTLAVYQP